MTSGDAILASCPAPLCDGQSHEIEVTISANQTLLLVDGQPGRGQDAEIPFDLLAQSSTFIGGLPGESTNSVSCVVKCNCWPNEARETLISIQPYDITKWEVRLTQEIFCEKMLISLFFFRLVGRIKMHWLFFFSRYFVGHRSADYSCMLPSLPLRCPAGVHSGLCTVQRLHGGLHQPAASGLWPGRPKTRHPLSLLPPAGLSPVTPSAKIVLIQYIYSKLWPVMGEGGGWGLRLEHQKKKTKDTHGLVVQPGALAWKHPLPYCDATWWHLKEGDSTLLSVRSSSPARWKA